ncbi:MAG: hypothetical protein UT87_C0028G0002 [Candidatus Levybacteria bacterium GW2011_GWC1_40_19]|nr:MAG: Peptidase M16 domain protein [Candidatus Levybacteria bacterium GW2011_GWA1_39_34]KKR49627.1 MAG: hypothetical protein UT87_C0028G0002 [Candidatus Levybacteria bacterium GW2011_GWC1_40_19]KKR73372.1 MAG: Peptidase M16 domain protein [Candidatus Levybacteria bacterium GW2011_GWC2_40_7]KKS00531.1 MAG: Peptidase M16 domain protein [Candidatus Levybacteria bacterium GW2011_GWB1_41_21]
MPSFESATVLIMVGAGSRYETKLNNGISHFLEHMAFKGTKKRPSAIQMSGLIDSIGGEFNAFTTKEYTGYYIKSSKNNIELSFDLLSDMVQNSLLDEKEIEKEKGVILEEINLYEDTPMRNIGDIYERLLYGDTPMGWDTAGEKDIIKKISRKDFLDYLKALYSPSNMVLAVAGGIEEKGVLPLAEKYFSDMNSFQALKAAPIGEKQEKAKVSIKPKKTEQAHLAIGFRTVPLASPEKYPLSVLSSILGGGMSSRLFHEVREKRGLAYYVRSNSDQYTDAGSLVATAGVDPKRINEAIEVILSEFQALKSGKKEISKEELKKGKEYLKGHLVLELEDSRSVSIFYATQDLLEEKIDNPADVLLEIDKVTTEDVMEAANKYVIDKTLNLAIIGNFDDRQRFEKLLKL